MLTDDARNARQIPTRANMLQAMRWLVQGAQPNDSLFFHLCVLIGVEFGLTSARVTVVKPGIWMAMKMMEMTKVGRKILLPSLMSVIYPLDFKQAGHIVDDESGFSSRYTY